MWLPKVRQRASGVVIIEAFATGLPLLASRVGAATGVHHAGG